MSPRSAATPLAIWDRDLWLVRAVHRIRPILSEYGLPLPKRVTVRVGVTWLPSGSASHPLGECWPSFATDAGVPGIVVNESVTDEMTILAVLVHELVHASDKCRSGHGSWFSSWARAVGLDGPILSTHAGPLLQRQLRPIARALGRYPRAHHGYCVSLAGVC